MSKPMREYQRAWRAKNRPRKDGKPRRSIKSDMQVLVGLAAGEITEGAAVKILGIDRIEVRERLKDAVHHAERQLKELQESPKI